MKKVITLILCLLILLQTTVFAEIKKTINQNQIILETSHEFEVRNTNKRIYIGFQRMGITNSQSFHYIVLLLWSPNSNRPSLTDITFSTKNMPHFVTTSNGIEKAQPSNKPLKIFIISDDTIWLEAKNGDMKTIAENENLSIILPLKDGNTEKIEIPDEMLTDWRYILSCDLKEEYKKGI